MSKMRVLIVDDHESVRIGVRAVLSLEPKWEVCGEAATGWSALEMAAELKPDVIVQDVTLPGLDGLEVARQIRKTSPDTEVVMFSGHLSEELVYQSFDVGARSYILKTDSSLQLLDAVRAAAEHKPYFTPLVSEIVFARFQQPKIKREQCVAGSILTPREREAVQIIAEGKSNKELASTMGVSLRTAESHRAAIMQKLKLGNIGELIRYAIRNGIVQP